jgi:hypothetical protein
MLVKGRFGQISATRVFRPSGWAMTFRQAEFTGPFVKPNAESDVQSVNVIHIGNRRFDRTSDFTRFIHSRITPHKS